MNLQCRHHTKETNALLRAVLATKAPLQERITTPVFLKALNASQLLVAAGPSGVLLQVKDVRG